MSQIHDDEHEVELIDYIEVVIRRKLLIVGISAACFVGAWLNSQTAENQYQAEALIVVSQTISKPDQRNSLGLSASEVIVPGLAVQTYEALAKGDELVSAILDSLQGVNLASDAAEFARGVTISGLTSMLTAEIVAATEKAESPLLSFRVKASSEDIAVQLVNLWVRLFVQRNQGLSANVADDYYRRVVDQHATARENFSAADRDLRALEAAHSRLSILERDTAAKSARLATTRRQQRQVETSLDGKHEELLFLDRTIGQVEWQGTWIGFVDAADLQQAERQGNGFSKRQQLIDLRRASDASFSDSLKIAPRHMAERSELEREAARRMLEFERLRQPGQLRAREIQLIGALDSLRADLARMEVDVFGLEVKSQVMQRNLADEPSTHTVIKAIVDDELWEQVIEKGRVESAVQEKLGAYRLVSQSVNPTHQNLRDSTRSAILAEDLMRSRIEYLRDGIPRLEDQLARNSEILREIASEEDDLISELTRRSVELEARLSREALSVTERLVRSRGALETAQEHYLQAKEQQVRLHQEVARLGAMFEHQKRNVLRLEGRLEDQIVEFDSLAVLRDRLSGNRAIYKQSFEHFSRLLEQSRIAREQAAGDIQIVSNAVIARPVPRGLVKKATIAGVMGLMASTMLAFLLEYVSRARQMKQEPTPTT